MSQIADGSGRFATMLIAAIEEFIHIHNDNPRPFVWTATADEITEKVRRGRAVLQTATQD
jgi:hypothetical protein